MGSSQQVRSASSIARILCHYGISADHATVENQLSLGNLIELDFRALIPGAGRMVDADKILAAISPADFIVLQACSQFDQVVLNGIPYRICVGTKAKLRLASSPVIFHRLDAEPQNRSGQL